MNIILRKWKLNDIPSLVKYLNNIKIWNNVRDRMPSPYTQKDAEEFISKQKIIDPNVNFAIVYNNEVTGGISILLKEDVSRIGAEIGYWLAEPFWGKGITTAAIGQLADYAFKNFAIERLYAEVYEHNKASMRTLEKNGFYLESIRKKAVIKNNVVMNDHVYVKLKK